MRIRKRQKLASPVTLVPGDTLQVTWRETATFPDGTVAFERETVLIEDTITKSATYDEAFTFDDEIDGRAALGGGVIEAKSE